MNLIICDGNLKDRQLLKNLLIKYQQKKKLHFDIAEFDYGSQLFDNANTLQNCQLVFLDINMDKADGLQTAMKIKESFPQIPIILITAYMNYVLDGYKVKASRFLLKDDLDKTLPECMDDILKEIRQQEQTVQFSFVEGKISLPIEDIIYIETSRHKNLFYTKTQVYSLYKKLNEIEEELKGMGFLRVHLSFLVNMRYIEKISSYVLKLTTGKELSVPKARYQEVKRQFMLYKESE